MRRLSIFSLRDSLSVSKRLRAGGTRKDAPCPLYPHIYPHRPFNQTMPFPDHHVKELSNFLPHSSPLYSTHLPLFTSRVTNFASRTHLPPIQGILSTGLNVTFTQPSRNLHVRVRLPAVLPSCLSLSPPARRTNSRAGRTCHPCSLQTELSRRRTTRTPASHGFCLEPPTSVDTSGFQIRIRLCMFARLARRPTDRNGLFW